MAGAISKILSVLAWMQDSALDSLVAARHAVLADLAQSARPSTPAETDSTFTHSNLLPASGMSVSSIRGDQPVLDPLMQARALVRMKPPLCLKMSIKIAEPCLGRAIRLWRGHVRLLCMKRQTAVAVLCL